MVLCLVDETCFSISCSGSVLEHVKQVYSGIVNGWVCACLINTVYALVCTALFFSSRVPVYQSTNQSIYLREHVQIHFCHFLKKKKKKMERKLRALGAGNRNGRRCLPVGRLAGWLVGWLISDRSTPRSTGDGDGDVLTHYSHRSSSAALISIRASLSFSAFEGKL